MFFFKACTFGFLKWTTDIAHVNHAYDYDDSCNDNTHEREMVLIGILLDVWGIISQWTFQPKSFRGSRDYDVCLWLSHCKTS